MILSSADIVRVLGGDPIIRQEARISIVDVKPGFGLDEYVYIYVERYPSIDDFEATWRIWVQNGGSDVLDLVLAAMTRLLPKFEFQREGVYSTTDFKSSQTVVRPAEEIALEKVAQATGTIEQRFATLEKAVLARLATIRDGIDGQDGLDGLAGAPGTPGRDGRDGRDLVATDANLEDLQNVEQNIAKEDGQVLTWKDGVWQNLFIPQIISSISGGGAGGGVTQIVAGNNITIDPISGTGIVTINAASSAGSLPNGDYANQPLTWNGSAWTPGSEIQFDLTNTADPAEGGLTWEQDEHTAVLGINGMHAHLGHDSFVWARNSTGTTIAKGTAVMFVGTLGNSGRLLVAPMVADGTYPGYVFLGVAAESIAPGVDGNVYTQGKIKGINTSTFTEGAILWCDPAIPGGLTETQPSAPNIKLPIAAVISSQSNGILMIRAKTGERLQDLHDVQTAAPSDGDVLTWVSASGRWEHLQPVTGGIPEAPQDGNYYVRHNGTWVDLATAMDAVNGRIIDGGDITNNTSAGDNTVIDGGVAV